MKLVVMGATGGIGLEVLHQAIGRGHSVTAFVRSPERLKPFGDGITVIQGDLLNSAEVAQAIEGHDAILSAFGPRVPVAKDEAHDLQRFATALASAIRQTTVRRAVVVSTSLLFRDSIIPPTYLVGQLFFPTTIADASKMEEIIASSDFDWTLVRPTRLTDKPRTGKYRIREEHLPNFGFTISRADVADFMLDTIEKVTSLRKVVGITN